MQGCHPGGIKLLRQRPREPRRHLLDLFLPGIIGGLILRDADAIEHILLGFLQLLHLLELCGGFRGFGLPQEVRHFQRTLANPNVSGTDKAKLLYAFAWVLARRVEPGLTWNEMLTYDLEITGETPSVEQQQDTEFRAKAIMGVVKATGVSPAEAERMTLAQVNAAMPRTRRRKVG